MGGRGMGGGAGCSIYTATFSEDLVTSNDLGPYLVVVRRRWGVVYGHLTISAHTRRP